MSTLTKNKKPNAFVRLTKHSEFTIGLVVIALFLLAPYLVGFYAMPQTTTDLALSVLQVNCVVTVLIWPSSAFWPSRRPSSSSRAVSIFPAAPSPVSAA